MQLRDPGQRAGAVHAQVWAAQLCTGGRGWTTARGTRCVVMIRVCLRLQSGVIHSGASSNY